MPIRSSVVSVGVVATLLSVGGSGDLHTVVIRNDSGVTVYVGGDDVTVANGFAIATAGSLTLDLANADAIYGIVAAATAAVQVLKTRQ